MYIRRQDILGRWQVFCVSRTRAEGEKLAILAMRHARFTVFAGAILALSVMSILSALLGHVVPTLLPRQWTTIAAALLFYVFGARMLQEGYAMPSGSASIEEEMKEVAKEIEETSDFTRPGLANGHANGIVGLGFDTRSASLEDAEEGKSPRVVSQGNRPLTNPGSQKDRTRQLLDGIKNLCALFLSPVLMQAFVLTFLAEWGDRSQVTTIALGAAHVCLLLIH